MASKSPDSVRDFFQYLLKMGMLYVGIVSGLSLLFHYTGVLWPDPLDPTYADSLQNIRNAMASLIVAWPMFIFLAFYIRREMKLHSEKVDVWVRKRLLYLTLFVASVTMIVDLIVLVNYFLNGELTLRFVIKVFSVLIIVGLTFAYYLWDLKHDAGLNSKLPKYSAIASVIGVVILIGSGFFIVGSPQTQRQVRLDQERVNDLNDIQNEVINYWTQKRELPEDASVLENSLSGFSIPTDPDTNIAYEYSKTGDLSFSLCATFTSDNTEEVSRRRGITNYIGPWGQENWAHKSERTCFERTIDPDLYPTQEELGIKVIGQ